MAEGHVLCSPVHPEEYMGLLCFKNGASSRVYVRDTCAEGDWVRFAQSLASTAPGNGGNVGFYFLEPEIVPALVKGVYRFATGGKQVKVLPPCHHISIDVEVRAVIESQFLSMRLHAVRMGLDKPSSILATGGGSSNTEILTVLANVFGVDVYTGDTPNSAALGAAYRAYHAYTQREAERTACSSFATFDTLLAGKVENFVVAAVPDLAAHDLYTAMVETYSALEQRLVEQFSLGCE